MRLGIGSYTFAWAVGVRGFPLPPQPMTPLALLDAAAALEVRLVQFADNLPLDRLPPEALDELLARARPLGIELELGMRGIAAEEVHRHLTLAARLGARLLRVVVDTAEHRPPLAEIVAALRGFVPACERLGVTLAIENHDRFPATTLRDLFEQVGHPRIGLCFDTANSLGCMEGANHVLSVLGPYIVNVHVKDVRVARLPHHFGFLVEGRPAGAGQLDIPELLRRVREHGRDPNVILELWPPPADTIAATIAQERAWAEQSVRYLRSLLPD